MKTADIAELVEVLFSGGYPDDQGPEPLNRRFNWKDPVSGKRPPKPPKAMLPTQQDFDALETPHQQIPVAGGAEAATPIPVQPADQSDRVGKFSLDDVIPPGEMATIDDLLDQYYARQKSEGPDAAKAWFDRYRPEFESVVRKIVDYMLG